MLNLNNLLSTGIILDFKVSLDWVQQELKLCVEKEAFKSDFKATENILLFSVDLKCLFNLPGFLLKLNSGF